MADPDKNTGFDDPRQGMNTEMKNPNPTIPYGKVPDDDWRSREGEKSQPPEEQRVSDVLEALKVDNTNENREQMKVYLMAFEVFIERNRRHRAQWRVGGLQGLLVDIRKKVERMWNEFMLSGNPPKDLDSPIDGINYLAFFVQAVQEERRTNKKVGTWLWPNDDKDSR